MLFTRSAIEALPHLELAASALRGSTQDLQVAAVLTARGWTVCLQTQGGLTVARACFSSAARADAFLARLAATCGRSAPRSAMHRRSAPAANSRGAIASADGEFVYLSNNTANAKPPHA